MEYDKIIKKLCIDKNISLAELARRTNQKPQTLSNKLARKDFKTSEFERLLNALNVSLQLVDNKTGEVL